MRIGHVAITVCDLERSEKFYKDAFGFVCVERIEDKEGRFVISIIKKGKITLELFSHPQSKPLPHYRRKLDSDLKVCGVKHFALEVKDIEKEYHELRRKKIGFLTGIENLGKKLRYFFIKDPDGIFIEVVENKIA
ncbi:MAG: glyoxalase/bleomycin resistance/dioxygenase family protein [Candidatus Omnitrophota bacterium]|nr:MAG: glyoxalase/bleomycin resistance/dioxygenase family protein [Candidatus Omnitrophota bacterium]